MFLSEGCKEIARQMIDNPEDWKQGEYEFINKINPDIRIWTSNGTSCIKLHGNNAFNIFEKMHLNSAIKKSIAKRLLSSLPK